MAGGQSGADPIFAAHRQCPSLDCRSLCKTRSLLDRNGAPINFSDGKTGVYSRAYQYPNLAPITGYTNPTYGQSGLEASLDPRLRGLQGNPASSIWWDHLVYGQPPPGLDIRLSIDLGLQQQADALLGNHTGARIAEFGKRRDPGNGLSSHLDPNHLDEQAAALLQDPQSPLLDRRPGTISTRYRHAILAPGYWSFCSTIHQQRRPVIYRLGLYNTPELRLPVALALTPAQPLRLSPLQVALAAAALSHDGIRPAPRLVMAVNTPAQGWVVLPSLSNAVQVLPVDTAISATQSRMVTNQPFWQWSGLAGQGKNCDVVSGGNITQLAGYTPGSCCSA